MILASTCYRILPKSILIWFILIASQSLAQPIANFKSDTTNGCAPVTVNFINSSTGQNLSYKWVFGNGNISTLKNPEAIYYLPGRYEVSLTVTNSNGKKSTKTISQYIHVFKNPIADFSGDPLKGCIPLSTRFKHTSKQGDGKINSFVWDFGDGNTLKDSVGLHDYKNQGIFNVSLVVIDLNNCQSKKFIPKYVEALPTPKPDISADKKVYCKAPFTVNFKNTTSGLQSSDSYIWDFGDEYTSTELNPKHTFSKSGNYTVSLTVTKSNGCSSTKVFSNYIVIGDINPDFTSITQACAPAKIDFTNISTPGRESMSYTWDFGDGNTARGMNVSHTYEKEGTYDVKLTATIDNTCTSTITKANYIRIDEAPIADFNFPDSIACKAPKYLFIKNNSQNTSKIKWRVNGVSSGTTSELGYTFTEFKTYDIELIAYNFLGCTDTMRNRFVLEKPNVLINADVLKGCVELKVNFSRSYSSFDPAKTFDWSFEPGKNFTGMDNPISHTFKKEGTYNVIVELTTKTGCKAKDTVQIRVGLKTNPSFDTSTVILCNNMTETFINTTDSKGVTIDSFRWLLGNGNKNYEFSQAENGTLITKHPPGVYDVLLITQNNGCSDTFIAPKMVEVLAPLAQIVGDSRCRTDTFVRTNSSIEADSFIWKIYAPNGTFLRSFYTNQIRLPIEYNYHHGVLEAYNFKTGCKDTSNFEIYFNDIPTIAEFEISGPRCSPASISLSATSDVYHTYTFYTPYDTLDGTDHTIEFSNPGNYEIKLVIYNPLNHCKDSVNQSVTITGPVVSGDLIGTEGCAPLSIQLKNNSDVKQFSSLYWLIDTTKIHITSIGTISHKLLKPGLEADGIYNIQLVGIDSNGCQGSETFPIKVTGVLGAEIKIRRSSDCGGRKFIFQAIAPNLNPDSVDISWDFGDGTTATGKIQNKQYEKDGIYDIVLQLSDSKGCTTVVHRIMNIDKERLNADFVATTLDSDCPPLFVQFKNLSTTTEGRKINKWLWDFGDGSTSIESDPSKLYLFAGKFTVKLFIEDENDCKDSIVFNDFILVNGPEGTYSFDKKEGCVPLDVNFSSTQKGASKLEFDMGDGVVYKDVANFKHTYRLPGRYIPLMVLTDSFGCTYTLPPIDTIYVYAYPVPSFVTTGVCFGSPISFEAITRPEDGEVKSYTWLFKQGIKTDSSQLAKPQKVFNGNERPYVSLTVTNAAGCEGSFEDEVALSRLNSDIAPNSKFNCVGNNIQVKSEIFSDTIVTAYEWLVGDSTFNTKDITFKADTTGPQQIRLIVTNAMNCVDTLYTSSLVIGDTIKPVNQDILRVTVNNDESVQLDVKMSPLNDFAAYEIYKEGNSGYSLIYEQEDRNKNTFVETNNNTLHNVYCYRAEVRNACGILSDSALSVNHCTVEVSASGEVNRAVLKWNKYVGWSDVSGYEVTREVGKNSGNFITIGSTLPNQTSFIDSNIVCHVEHVYKIKAIEKLGNAQVSYSDTCKAKPIWLSVIEPNKLIRASVENDDFITIDWDSVPSSRVAIDKYVVERSDDGNHYNLAWDFESDEFNLEDKKVLVDDQSYFYRTYAVDQCNDTSDYQNFGKTILLHADTTFDQRPILKWSTYQGWDEGVDFYDVEIKNPDQSFSFIGRTSNNDTVLVDETTDLNQRPNYCYRIIGYRNTIGGEPQIVSISNEDCSPVHSALYYPNAFTPNVDNLNEQFHTPGIYILDYHISIYSRWGEKIFESINFNDSWDGTYQGKPCPMGAYVVIIESVGVDRVKRRHFGTITLLR
jgi:gliding motility-associated-like protein